MYFGDSLSSLENLHQVTLIRDLYDLEGISKLASPAITSNRSLLCPGSFHALITGLHSCVMRVSEWADTERSHVVAEAAPVLTPSAIL